MHGYIHVDNRMHNCFVLLYTAVSTKVACKMQNIEWNELMDWLDYKKNMYIDMFTGMIVNSASARITCVRALCDSKDAKQ